MRKQPISFEKILAFVVSAGLAFFFVWLAFSDQAMQSNKGKKVESIIEDAANYFREKKGTTCDSVVSSCDLTLEEESEICNPELMYESLRKKLLSPLQFPECQSAKNRLSELCENSCPLDYDSVISVPGGIKLDIRGIAGAPYVPEQMSGEDGCIARGRRSVVFRGICGK